MSNPTDRELWDEAIKSKTDLKYLGAGIGWEING